MTKTVKIAAAAFLSAAALIIAGIGVDFSPGFSEGFVFCFVAAQLILLILRKPAWAWIGTLGALLLLAGSYIYAAGDDHLRLCVRLALAGTVVGGVLIFLRQRGERVPLPEGLLRLGLLAAGLFTLLCGLFSTALLPLALGVLLCLAARVLTKAQPWLTLVGLLLCDVFLIAPLCFPGGV